MANNQDQAVSLNGGGKTSCDNGEKEKDLAKQK